MARKPMKRTAVLADTLYNMHQSSGASDEYRKGIIVGVVGALMGAKEITFEQAVHVAAFHMPDAGARLMVPESWLVPFGTAMTKLRKTYILPV